THAAAHQVSLLASRAAAEGGASAIRDDRALRALFDAANAGDPTIFDLAVFDAQGLALAHSDTARIGETYPVRPRLAELQSGTTVNKALRLLGTPRTYEEVLTLRAGPRPFGDVRVGVSTTLLRAQLIASLRTGLWVAALSTVAAMLLALLLAQILAARVKAIERGLERFRKGEFGYRLAVEGKDEIALLASSINALGERLESARNRASDGEAARDELLAATGHLSVWAKVASGLAHEMADPLNAAALHLGHLKRKLKEPHTEAGRHLRVLEEELKRLEGVVLGFRRFAMLGEVQNGWFDLRELLDEIARRAREDRVDPRIEVRIEHDGTPSRFWGDRALLRQAIANLVGNAEQAMPGGGTITVRGARSGSGISVVVADEGVGIPADLQARVFDLYFSTRAEGSGIGLAVVQQVIALHGGKVSLRSTPGEGTEIRIELPVRQPERVEVA
ncbi:MAG: HAMP domain-containing protein, partial [Candidatus Eisenbacteria bacterium]|nr:HAMP domain-containing protein [Candidatus Eisenbacteria bacterium]